MKPLKRIIHLIQFVIFGPIYFLLKFLIFDTMAILKKVSQPCEQDIDLICTYSLYKIFKKTIFHFKYTQKKDFVNIKVVVSKLKENLALVVVNDENELNDKMRILCEKITFGATDNLVNVGYWAHMIRVVKNKKVIMNKNEDSATLMKMRSMEIILSQFDKI